VIVLLCSAETTRPGTSSPPRLPYMGAEPPVSAMLAENQGSIGERAAERVSEHVRVGAEIDG